MKNKDRADRAVNFIKLLRHTKGEYAKQKFNLMKWQEKIIRDIFGNIDKNGYRVIKEAFIFLPRKNGKSELAAALALYGLFADDEYGAEIYSAANSREQASLVFNCACAMVRMNKALSKRCRIIESQKRIVRYDTNSFYRAISAESSTAHGFNAHMVIFDEIHEAKTRDLYDVLRTSMGGRRQPLFINITTAGTDKNSVCYQLFDYSKKINDGIIKDNTFYPVLYYADQEADIYNEIVWKKANPGLANFRSLDEMRIIAKRSKEIPEVENTFRRLYLNQWVTEYSKWLNINKWKECGEKDIDLEYLEGRICYAGLDLSSTTDISALVLTFPDDTGEEYYILPFFFIPDENMIERVKRDRVPYDVWVKQGLMQTTEGNVIHYGAIFNKINELHKKYNIKEIAYDRWGATKLSQDLEDAGFTMVGFGQGFASMSPASKELETMTLQKKIYHGNNKVLNWMMSNTVVRTDPAGNIKPDKSKSIERIDGVIATIMSLDRAVRNSKPQDSIYENRGVISF
ncbi:MAG: terminase [Clostridiales bacterium GWE2_32_10]|nr:MAG: terminase [Clostridiales bacterium GWE2_32_10]HBY19967.1 terminase [Clostridiales bacterium]